MSEIILSKRLSTIAKHIKSSSIVADIGSDHAYLPCYLAQQNIAPFIIAGEVAEGPYKSALKQVNECNLNEQISVRKGNGLSVIATDHVDCVTIAGMGGALIVNILTEGTNYLNQVSQLILQPNVGAHLVRKWLINNEWQLTSEEIVTENDKVYEILVAFKGEPLQHYSTNIEKDLLFGPFLRQEKNESFIKKWTIELKNLERILFNLKQAQDTPETIKKQTALNSKLNLIKEVINYE